MSNEKAVGLKFRIVLKIGDIVFNDVVSVTGTFDLNGIPTCSITLAVGRDATNTPATIHRMIDKLEPRAAAFVTATAYGRGSIGLTDQMVGKTFTVFEGRYIGPAWQRSGNAASFQLVLTHWIDDLNTTAILNSNFHPGSAYNASVGAVVPTGNGGNGVAWAQILPDLAENMATHLQKDTWLEALHPWLKYLAEINRLNSDNSLLSIKAARTGNDTALAALARMTGTGKKSGYVPLALKYHGAATSTIADCIASYLTSVTLESWTSPTIWGKLIGEWRAQLMFSICPRIEDAIAVPFAGPLRKHYKLITSDEYTHFGRVADLSQVLLGIGIMHGATSSSGADGVAGASDDKLAFLTNLAGWYPPTASQNERGVIMMKLPPQWLTSNVEQTRFGAATTGADGEVIGGVLSPGAGQAPTTPAAASGQLTTGTFLDQYAKHWFSLESLQGRTTELAGKLRFDIAPGSQIKIEGRGEQFVENDATAVPMYATVMRVSFVIDAEGVRAGTAFSLAHVRTEAENAREQYVMDGPPLYDQPWYGAPLLDIFG